VSGVDVSVPNDGFDLEVLFPELWTVHPLGDDQRAIAVAELAERTDGQADDPAAVAEPARGEVRGKRGAGRAPSRLPPPVAQLSCHSRHDVLALVSPHARRALGGARRAAARAELGEVRDGKVGDPAAVAEASRDEFMGKIGAGSEPIMLASFRESLSDDSVLGASLIVTRNALGGSLEPWSEAYGDNSVEVDVLGAPALRIEERSAIAAGEIFDEPVHIVTWRYVVPVDASSVVLFAFSTPNHELDELLLAHFDEIMQHISIVPAAG